MRIHPAKQAANRLSRLRSMIVEPNGVFARNLIIVIALTSVGAAGVATNIVNRFLDGFWHTFATLVVTVSLFFLLGWMGIIIILRRELLYLARNAIRGKPAVIAGAIETIFCWGFSLWSFWRLVLLLIRPELATPP